MAISDREWDAMSDSCQGGEEMKQRILIALDGSENARRALREVSRWIDRAVYEHLTLITITEPVSKVEQRRMSGMSLHASVKKVEEEAREMAEECAAVLREEGIPYVILVGEGKPGEQIVSTVRDGEYDLVVLGQRGRNPFSELLLGSVSSYVLHHAPVSVLLVK